MSLFRNIFILNTIVSYTSIFVKPDVKLFVTLPHFGKDENVDITFSAQDAQLSKHCHKLTGNKINIGYL